MNNRRDGDWEVADENALRATMAEVEQYVRRVARRRGLTVRRRGSPISRSRYLTIACDGNAIGRIRVSDHQPPSGDDGGVVLIGQARGTWWWMPAQDVWRAAGEEVAAILYQARRRGEL